VSRLVATGTDSRAPRSDGAVDLHDNDATGREPDAVDFTEHRDGGADEHGDDTGWISWTGGRRHRSC
jgi:hypothetical protein